MKRFFTLVCLVLCAFTLAVISFAHPGDTDGSGGHYNHDTGEYHYHHGYPEHQHPDGVCPYNHHNNSNSSAKKYDTLNVIEAIFTSLGGSVAAALIAIEIQSKLFNVKKHWLIGPLLTFLISAILIFIYSISA